MRALLLDKFWSQFHHVWGISKECRYDKQEWIKLQECCHDFLRWIGLERRTTPRNPS